MTISDDRKELLRKKISNWSRQSRHRAIKNGCIVNLTLNEIVDIYNFYEYKCAYCGGDADSPECPFPIKDHAPCVQANVLPCCDKCRDNKKTHDMIWFYKNNFINKEKFIELLNSMKSRNGKADLVAFLKTLIPSDD